jgi:hypothetical protein
VDDYCDHLSSADEFVTRFWHAQPQQFAEPLEAIAKQLTESTRRAEASRLNVANTDVEHIRFDGLMVRRAFIRELARLHNVRAQFFRTSPQPSIASHAQAAGVRRATLEQILVDAPEPDVSLVILLVLLSDAVSRSPRLKVCRNSDCRDLFFTNRHHRTLCQACDAPVVSVSARRIVKPMSRRRAKYLRQYDVWRSRAVSGKNAARMKRARQIQRAPIESEDTLNAAVHLSLGVDSSRTVNYVMRCARSRTYRSRLLRRLDRLQPRLGILLRRKLSAMPPAASRRS